MQENEKTASEMGSNLCPELPKGESALFGAGVRGALEREGDQIGPYKLIEVLGEGGFGIVWLAERKEPIHQVVALKTIKPGMDAKMVIARFEQERQALACMNHPNIAKVFDAGLTPLGRPFFVMELVKGARITQYCDDRKLSIQERLELFVGVCEAVQHAHSKGIVHRDIKPSNILVMEHDGKATPKVIDFGVAKVMAGPLSDGTLITSLDTRIGTLAYMSPEQTGIEGMDVDLRTDIYSLGVVLYELITGVLPFEPAMLHHAARQEAERIIREKDPPAPSTRLSTGDSEKSAEEIAVKRKTHAPTLVRTLRNELEWMPLMAMRKDRGRRYQTASEMAEDVKRYLRQEPLKAGPESAAYRARKFVSRNRVGVGLTAVGAAGVIALAFMAMQVSHEREVAALKASEAAALGGMVEATISALNPGLKERGEAEKSALSVLTKSLDAGKLALHPEIEKKLRNEIALAESYRNDSVEAAKQYKKMMDDAVRSGDESLATFSRLNYAAALVQASDFAGAAAQLQEVEKSAKSLEIAGRARLLSIRAAILHGNKKVAEALTISRQAVEMVKPLPADYASLKFEILADAGGRCLDIASPAAIDECIELLTQARDILKNDTVGQGPQQRVKMANRLGIALIVKGRPAEAIPVLREALDGPGRSLELTDKELAGIWAWLPKALSDQERFIEAAAISWTAAAAVRESKGDDANQASLLTQFGIAARELGTLPEAIEALQTAAVLAHRAKDATAEGLAKGHLAELLRRQGKSREAEPIAHEAVALLESSPATLDVQLAEAQSVLGCLMALTGKAQEGLKMSEGSMWLVENPNVPRWRKLWVCTRKLVILNEIGVEVEISKWEDIRNRLKSESAQGK